MMADLYFDGVRFWLAVMAPMMLALVLSGCADPCAHQNRHSFCKSVG